VISLYVHFPWCVRKCLYCDFNSHEIKGAWSEADYLAALRADFAAMRPVIGERVFHSVFFGGGTPSLMQPSSVKTLLSDVPLIENAEITLEANPGAMEADKFSAFRDAGINRLSLGIQSFNDAHLIALGRIHSAEDAHRAIARAQHCFEHINLDLMTGLPGQTLADARRDMDAAVALAPGHLSVYALTLEPGTAFHRTPPSSLPDEDMAADMQDMAEALLRAAGHDHYETSAFARPGERCRHNLNYWTFGDYLGIGAGAHSKIDHHREARPRHPKDYLTDPVRRHWQAIAPVDLPGEFMMNALRLIEGVSSDLFAERTGLTWITIEKSVQAAQHAGLLETTPHQIRPTRRGQRFLNVLLREFF